MADSSISSNDARGGVRSFGGAFWALNSIEMFERLAYFTFRAVAPIYIMQANDPGGLHLTASHKGQIYAWWAIFQSLLPIVTGGFADRYGYKNTLVFAFTLMTGGYLMAALLRDVIWLPATDLLSAAANSNYWTLFISIMVLATGTAFFKPALQGSLAQNLHKENSSLGWGIFYWVVNIGGLIGPFVSAALLAKPPADSGMSPEQLAEFGKDAWRNLLLCAAGFAALNFLLLFTFRDVPSGANKTDSMLMVLWNTIRNIAEIRLIIWLIIMSGFWLMMYQLWDLQPNFIADWVDSAPLAAALAWLPERLYATIVQQTDRGPQVQQQILLNFNAAFIILLMIPTAWLTRKMRTLSAMLIGMIVASGGVLVAGWTMSVWVLVLGVLMFSLGEMTTGPKKNEYLGLIAPPGKKGLYLGYVNIPVGVGVYCGSLIAGHVYEQYGEKANLALKYLLQHTSLGAGKIWDGDAKSLVKLMGIPRTDAFGTLLRTLDLDATQATQLLWNTYNPHYVWIPFAAIGVVCAVALAIFGQMAKRWKDMNA
ncbi:MAG: MFS transporter [Phycisphaerae bacterium]